MTRAKVKLLPVSGAILNFGVKESPVKVDRGTSEKLPLENMGMAFGILSLCGTEPAEIHLRGNLPPAPNCNARFKTIVATLGLVVAVVAIKPRTEIHK